jgi:pimeloyl-ACP methyl ester carboxylesterase
MPLGRTCRAALVAVLASLAAASAASAACPEGAQCGTVTVPLDHSGRTAGTLSIAYAKVPATGTRTGTLVLLSGGPGQAALPLTTGFAELVEPLRSSYDIVTVDQRGTGDSGAVECELDEVADCATKLGARRAFYSTPETARDLEDVRVALGVDKLTLLGVSYGGKVASEYVRRYPERTAAVVLDSPAPVDGLDGIGELRPFGAPRVMNEVCFPGLCSSTVTDADEALAAAAERLQEGALSGLAVSPSGRVSRARVTEADLYSLLIASDLSPALRAGLPAAIASLAAGDATPLVHLAIVLGGSGDGGGDDDEINAARLLATTCIEARLPWAPESPVAPRADALMAFAAERASAFAPFTAETVLESSPAELCATWPPTPRPEAVPYAGPNVPVLVISGREDLRTPLESARRTAAQYPNAKVLAVPAVGHSVLSSDPSGCARAGLIAFLRGAAVEQCSQRNSRIPLDLAAAPYSPATISRLRPTGLPGLRGRTLSAITVTLTGIGFDASTQGTSKRFRLPGLRAGSVRANGSTLTLRGVEWISGVRVSGTIDGRRRTTTVTVSGPAAAPGTVTITRSSASGTLGGESFRLRG